MVSYVFLFKVFIENFMKFPFIIVCFKKINIMFPTNSRQQFIWQSSLVPMDLNLWQHLLRGLDLWQNAFLSQILLCLSTLQSLRHLVDLDQFQPPSLSTFPLLSLCWWLTIASPCCMNSATILATSLKSLFPICF